MLDPYTLLRMSGKELRDVVEGDDADMTTMDRLLAQEEIDRRKEKRARLHRSFTEAEARYSLINNLPEDENKR